MKAWRLIFFREANEDRADLDSFDTHADHT